MRPRDLLALPIPGLLAGIFCSACFGASAWYPLDDFPPGTPPSIIPIGRASLSMVHKIATTSRMIAKIIHG